MAQVEADNLDRWRKAFYSGDQLDASVCRRLIEEVERLHSESAASRVGFSNVASFEKRLADMAAYNPGGCRTCRDAEARAFLAKL
jgi:hypothetical protein